MAKNKTAKKKEKSRAKRIPIITAIIAAAAVVIAAMIGILPNLLQINSQQRIKQQTTGIQNEYKKYDDPLGIYSVSLPSNLVVASRENAGSNIITLFVPEGFNAKTESEFDTTEIYSLILVAIQESPVTTEDVEKFNEKMLIGIVQQNPLDVGNLIFNRKTSKGFFIKYKTTGLEPKRFTYIFGEWDNNTFAVVTFSVLESNDSVYEDLISYAVENFVWYPTKIIEYLKP